jgi:hypothetical protein
MAEQGKITVGVEPAIARRFFTDSTFAIQRALVAEPLYIELGIVRGTWFLAPVTLLISFCLAWVAFGWWSVLLIPGSVILWFLHNGKASMGRPALWPLVVAVGLVSYWALVNGSHPAYWWVAMVLAAMLLSRITYRCSSGLFRLLIIRNMRAYSLFRESAIFVRE